MLPRHPHGQRFAAEPRAGDFRSPCTHRSQSTSADPVHEQIASLRSSSSDLAVFFAPCHKIGQGLAITTANSVEESISYSLL